MSHQVKSTLNLIFSQGARLKTCRNENLGKAGNTPENVQKTDKKKLNLRPIKQVVMVPEKESGATGPTKSHKKQELQHCRNMAHKLRSKQARLSHDQNI